MREPEREDDSVTSCQTSFRMKYAHLLSLRQELKRDELDDVENSEIKRM